MRLASYERFGVSPLRMAGIGGVAAALAGTALATIAGPALGGATWFAGTIVAGLVMYAVMSTPRRVLDRERVSQAKESVVLGAAAAACLSVTGSRSKTLMMLKPRDRSFGRAVTAAARMVLLGSSVEGALADASGRVASYSAAETLRGIASLKPGDFDEGDEEVRGLASSSELYRETKLPMLLTACFFSPIMLVLYAVFTHSYSPVQLLGLIAVQFTLLDLALYFSSGDRGPG